MKKQYQIDHNLDFLKHKLISNHEQHYYPSAKRIIKNTNDISQNKSFAYITNTQYLTKTTRTNQQIPQNPQKVKSLSLHQTSKVGSRIQYLTYAHKQYKEQKKIQEPKYTTIDVKQLAELKNNMEKYFIQLQKKDEIVLKYQKVINEKERNIQQANQRMQIMQHNCQRYQTQCSSLYRRLKQIQQFCSAITNNHNSLSQKCALLEQILQQKDASIQKIIFSKDQEYHSAMKCKNNEMQVLQQRLNILQAENSLLMDKISSLQRNPQNNQDKSKECKGSDMATLGQQFQSRINYYVEENSKLKNIVAHYEGQIEHLQTHKYSLQAILKAYEERDQSQKTSSKQQEELNFLRNALQNQKDQKDRSISKYQLQILKLENQISTKQLSTHSKLINMFDEQRLHQSLYIALDQIERLRIKLGEANKAK